MPDPVISLEVGGQKLTNWQSLTITRDLDSLADGFSFVTPYNPEDRVLRALLRPASYPPCKVRMDGQLLISGRVEKNDSSTTADDRSLSLEGRSLGGILMDCSVVPPFEYHGQTIQSLAKQIVKPFGLTIIPVNESGLLGTPSALVGKGQPYGEMGEVRAGTGDIAGAFLLSQAKTVALLINSQPDGTLQIMRPNPKNSPVAHIIEGQGAFVSAGMTVDGTKLFSVHRTVNAMGQWNDVTHEISNPLVPIYRIKTTMNEGNVRQIEEASRWDRALSIADAITVQCVVNSWTTDSGHVWDKGDVVTLLAPGADINNETTFIVAGATLTLTPDEGRKATLRLVLPLTYTAEMPTVWPWDEAS